MAKIADEFKYPSITTKGLSHDKPAAFASEILVYRHATQDRYELPEYFWRNAVDCPQKYKDEYKANIDVIGRLIKLGIPDYFIVQACFYSKFLNYTNHGLMTAIVRKRWATWKKNVSNRLINQANEMMQRSETAEVLEEEVSQITEQEEIVTRKKQKKNKITY